MKPSDLIDQHLKDHNGRYPRNDSLAKKLGTTVEEATKELDRHKAKAGVRVRSPIKPEPEKPSVMSYGCKVKQPRPVNTLRPCNRSSLKRVKDTPNRSRTHGKPLARPTKRFLAMR